MEEVPTAPISSNLQVISSVLVPYAQIVSRSNKPIGKRKSILLVIQKLSQRISALRIPEGGEQPFLIYEDELEVAIDALASFTENIARLLPESPQRNEIITACEELREYLSAIFSPPVNDE